jgi:hypothetical protein
MSADLQCRVKIYISPTNASVFRTSGRAAVAPSKPEWVTGTLSLRSGTLLDLTISKNRRLGNQVMMLRVPAKESATDGFAELGRSFFHREIQLARRGMPVRVRLSETQLRALRLGVRGS